jgi:hypothetical protein
VTTLEDFGSQGTPPSHPELLDWLAVDFVENGWNIKTAMRKIVLSATYRQSSHVTTEQYERDPPNQFLGRGPRHRLAAEFIRDGALKISGQLVDQIGGPSVHPYQPAGLLYRRGIYTYWKRTVPPPSLVCFDAPNREIGTMRRSTTNTPLQALVLLNDPQYVEAARSFDARILLEAPPDTRRRLEFAFEAATSRVPSPREIEVLTRAVERELQSFSNNPDAAIAYLRVGESPRNERLDLVEHAAWATIANLILNLSETITKQ